MKEQNAYKCFRYVHEGSSGPSAIKLFDPAQLEAAGAAALAGFARDEKAVFAREDSAYIARDFPLLSRKAQGTGYACYYVRHCPVSG